VTIVTLNHDVLVETLLEKHFDWRPGIDFEDGFGPAEDDVRKYDPERLFNDSARLRLIKPHGSINWYFDDDGPTALLPSARRECFSKSEPSFLSGIGKEGRYQYGIFGDMVEAFQHVLRQTTTVIESGFGWQDEGMYNLLTQYLCRRTENQLLRLHPMKDRGPEIKLPDHAQLRPRPEGLIDGPNHMCYTSWDDIKNKLGLP
jgi:hypothetical protein